MLSEITGDSNALQQLVQTNNKENAKFHMTDPL